MKTRIKKAKAGRKGKVPSRRELIAAHECFLKKWDAMTGEQKFESLVEAGIYTPDGKLTPRYDG